MGNHVVRWRHRVLADFADNQRHAAARFLGLLLLLQRLHPRVVHLFSIGASVSTTARRALGVSMGFIAIGITHTLIVGT